MHALHRYAVGLLILGEIFAGTMVLCAALLGLLIFFDDMNPTLVRVRNWLLAGFLGAAAIGMLTYGAWILGGRYE